MFLPIYNLAQKRGAWAPSLDLLLMYHCWVIPIENMENLKNDCFLENNIDSFDTIYYPLASEVARGYSNATFLPSVRHNPCEHSGINILQWILTKLGTYLVLKRIWNPIDFQGHRSKVKVTGSNFYRVTSLWTLESTFNGFSPNLVHT
jgi:hypothetical protein